MTFHKVNQRTFSCHFSALSHTLRTGSAQQLPMSQEKYSGTQNQTNTDMSTNDLATSTKPLTYSLTPGLCQLLFHLFNKCLQVPTTCQTPFLNWGFVNISTITFWTAFFIVGGVGSGDGCAVHYRIWSSILGLYPLNTSSRPHPSHNNQKCLQTL